MQNSERLLLVFAGFFFGTIFGGLLVRELTHTDVAPAGPAVDPAAQNGPMERGSDGGGGGNQPGMEGGGANGAGDPAAVMAHVKALLEQYKKTPEKFESQMGLGQLYMQKQDFAQAASWYEKAYLQQPKNLDVLMDLGLCRLNIGDTPGAEKLFHEALMVKPDTAEALFALASVAWGARQDVPAALGYLDRLEKLRPGDADAAALRARVKAGKKAG